MLGLKQGNPGVCSRFEMNRFVHPLGTAFIDNSFVFVTNKAVIAGDLIQAVTLFLSV
jgi:hypothetical protein